MAASSSSAAQAASLVKEAVERGLLPEENPFSASGYAGVTEVKGKYQARVFVRPPHPEGRRAGSRAADRRWAAEQQESEGK